MAEGTVWELHTRARIGVWPAVTRVDKGRRKQFNEHRVW